MLDKFLCKKIHKEEITIKDVVRTLDNTIPLILSYLAGVLIVMCKVGVLSGEWSSSIKGFLIVFGVPLITAIPISIILTVVGLIILKMYDIIGSVRIARCPLNKQK